jgi:hypothetical protein
MEDYEFMSKTTDLNSTLWKFGLTPEGSPDYSQLSNIIRDFPQGYYPSYEFEKSSLDFGSVLELVDSIQCGDSLFGCDIRPPGIHEGKESTGT